MKQFNVIRISVRAMLAITIFAGVAGATAVNAQSQDKIVAVVNGKNITQKETDASIASQLLPLEQQAYALRKAAVENLISRAVLEETAKKRGISIDDLRKQLTAGKVEITASQVEQLYSENASVFASMSADEARERLRLDLESQARMKLYRDALAELRKSSSIEVRLEEPKLPLVITDTTAAPAIGSKAATVTIVEFSDFQCPYCRGAQSTLKKVLQSYGDDVRLVFKHLPLDIHAEAFTSAQSAYCAGEQGSFWKYQDALFTSDSLSPKVLKQVAAGLGLNLSKFDSCINSEASHAAILKDVDEARRLGINSTPTFIVNGRLVRGAAGFEDLKALIDRELASARSASGSQ